MLENNKAIIEKVNAGLAEGNCEEFLSFCAENVKWTIVGETTVEGKDAIRQWMTSMGEMEPPKITIKNVITEGDFGAAHGDMTMKEKGEINPYSFCDVYRFRDGKITELNSYVIKTETSSKA